MGFLSDVIALMGSVWSRGNRPTAIGIALLPIWFFLALGVFLVAGWIELALGIPGPSDAGKTIGSLTLVAFLALLFRGPIWSLIGSARVVAIVVLRWPHTSAASTSG